MSVSVSTVFVSLFSLIYSVIMAILFKTNMHVCSYARLGLAEHGCTF